MKKKIRCDTFAVTAGKNGYVEESISPFFHRSSIVRYDSALLVLLLSVTYFNRQFWSENIHLFCVCQIVIIFIVMIIISIYLVPFTTFPEPMKLWISLIFNCILYGNYLEMVKTRLSTKKPSRSSPLENKKLRSENGVQNEKKNSKNMDRCKNWIQQQKKEKLKFQLEELNSDDSDDERQIRLDSISVNWIQWNLPTYTYLQVASIPGLQFINNNVNIVRFYYYRKKSTKTKWSQCTSDVNGNVVIRCLKVILNYNSMYLVTWMLPEWMVMVNWNVIGICVVLNAFTMKS